MYGRYAFSIVIGVVVTMSLLFLMQVLIATGKQALTKPRDRAKLEFVRVKRNEALNTEDFTPEKPPKPPETPTHNHRKQKHPAFGPQADRPDESLLPQGLPESPPIPPRDRQDYTPMIA